MNEYKIPRSIWNLAQIYSNESNFEYPPDVPKIEVDQLASKLALVYEKLRYAVDYREEHLVRRHAIERIIKRNFLWKKDLTVSARALIEELIRAGYVQNSHLPESKIDDVAQVFYKYVTVIENLSSTNSEERRQLTNWLLTLSSVEIEYELISHTPQLKLLQEFYQYLKAHIVFEKLPLDEREKNIQLFIAAHKSLLKSDLPTISYHLFHLYVPSWQNTDKTFLQSCARDLHEVKKLIDSNLRDPFSDQLQRTIKKPSVYFSIIHELFFQRAQDIESLVFDIPSIENEIASICTTKYKTAKIKLRRSTVNSIIYVFLTKIILAFIIEVPYDLLVLGHINRLPLAANIFFHPFLMFLVATSTRIPTSKNTKKIILETKNILYGTSTDNLLHRFKKSPEIGSSKFIVSNFIYGVLYLITFGLVIWLLSKLGFNLASGMLFVFFLTVVSFFGIRIKNSARELQVLKKRENFISFVFDLLTLPLIRVGRWISINSSKVNIFIFLFDYIIETPFKTLVRSIETGIFYIKEKKEELYD